MIKEYFANYFLHMSDVTFDMKQHGMEVHQSVAEPWKVTLVDTGDLTGTGGRLKKVVGISTVRCLLHDLWRRIERHRHPGSIAFHRKHGGQVTVTAVHLQHGLALSASMARRSARFRKNHREKADGLMAAFSCCP